MIGKLIRWWYSCPLPIEDILLRAHWEQMSNPPTRYLSLPMDDGLRVIMPRPLLPYMNHRFRR